jgi:hypothetical protein
MPLRFDVLPAELLPLPLKLPPPPGSLFFFVVVFFLISFVVALPPPRELLVPVHVAAAGPGA